jgi:hypothetical protein
VEAQQNHSIHFDTHMKDAAEHEQEQDEPQSKYIHFMQAGAHLAMHLKQLQGDPTRKEEVKQKQKALDVLGKKTDQLQQQLEAAAKAAQAASPQQKTPDPDVLKVQGELALKAEKLKGEMALKGQKLKVSTELADKKTAAEIKRGDARAAAQIGQSGASTQARTRMDDARTASAIQRDAQKAKAKIALDDASTAAGISQDQAYTQADIEMQRQTAEAEPEPGAEA